MIPPSESHADRRRVKYYSFSFSPLDTSSRDCYFLFEWSSEFGTTSKYKAESSAVNKLSLPLTQSFSISDFAMQRGISMQEAVEP